MEQVFWTVLNRSVTAGWLVLALLAVRLVLKKAPRGLVYDFSGWITEEAG